MEEYKKKIRQFESDALIQFKLGNTNEAIALMEKAWNELPEPKYEKPESFLIARDLVFALNKIKKYEEALLWADKLMKSDLTRFDSGDREFMAGTVLYHLGRKDDAWQYFDVANEKSEGRCFINNNNKEYLKFFKSKKQ